MSRDHSDSQYYDIANVDGFDPTDGAFSIALLVKTNGVTHLSTFTDQDIFAIEAGGGTKQVFIEGGHVNPFGTSVIKATQIGTNYTIGLTWHGVVLTYSAGSNADVKFYVDGAEQSSASAVTPNACDGSFRVGNAGTGNERWRGRSREVAVWNRALTPAEAIALTKGFSPLFFRRGLIMFSPSVRTLLELRKGGTVTNSSTTYSNSEPRVIYPGRIIPTFLTPAAGGGVTISVPAGSLTLAGNAPTVVNPKTIFPPAGSLTLSGLAPTVTVSGNQIVQPPAGALSLTGNAPTVLTPRIVSPSAGALTLAGNAPTVAVSDNQYIVPPTGALTLAGNAPVVVNPKTLFPAAGALTLTGYAPTVDDGSLALESTTRYKINPHTGNLDRLSVESLPSSGVFSGSFTTHDGKTVTVSNGLIVSVV